MTFHTKQEVLDFFNNYEILKFKEVKQASIKQNGFEYYYEIFEKICESFEWFTIE